MVSKVIITGGVCAGKSTCLSMMEKQFKSLGCEVFIINEQATQLVSNGITHQLMNEYDEKGLLGYNWQITLVRSQIVMESLYLQLSQNLEAKGVKDIIILCDRGLLDGKAFESSAVWDKIMENIFDEFGVTETDILNSYDSVIHLETVAKGKPEFYTLENNKARTETIEEAIANDDKMKTVYRDNPHFHLVDNSGDFECKITRAIDYIKSDLKERKKKLDKIYGNKEVEK